MIEIKCHVIKSKVKSKKSKVKSRKSKVKSQKSKENDIYSYVIINTKVGILIIQAFFNC